MLKYINLIHKALDNMPPQRWQLVALLANKHPIAIATNDLTKTHPEVAKFNEMRRIHAEMRCIKKAPASKLKNGILYVARLSSDGMFKLAKPCDMCAEFIANAGIKKVFYSNNFGEFEEMRV